MRIIASVPEAEVVAAFLRAEIDSSRFGEAIRRVLTSDGVSDRLIRRPDLTSEHENAYRERLLGDVRGWKRNEWLFHGFPDDVEWTRAALTTSELRTVRYINFEPWPDYTGGSRRPQDAIRRGTVLEQDGGALAALSDRINGSEPIPEMILVGSPEGRDLVVLEGHLRLTAWVMSADSVSGDVECYVGTSSSIGEWSLY